MCSSRYFSLKSLQRKALRVMRLVHFPTVQSHCVESSLLNFISKHVQRNQNTKATNFHSCSNWPIASASRFVRSVLSTPSGSSFFLCRSTWQDFRQCSYADARIFGLPAMEAVMFSGYHSRGWRQLRQRVFFLKNFVPGRGNSCSLLAYFCCRCEGAVGRMFA